jgi:hypothetical protein
MDSTPLVLGSTTRSHGERPASSVTEVATEQADLGAHGESQSASLQRNTIKYTVINTETALPAVVPTIGEADERKKSTIAALPSETLEQIFKQLDGPAPSSSRLYDQPTHEITSSTVTPIKAASLVCWQWRSLLIPTLYRHARLIIPEPGIPTSIIDDEHIPFLNFVRKHRLRSYVKTYSLVIFNVAIRHTSKSDKEHQSNDFSSFWNKILEEIDPMEITLVCSPQVLGALTSCKVSSRHQGSFDIPYHILQLCRQGNPIEELAPALVEGSTFGGMYDSTESRPPLRHSVLLNTRPWTRMLLNEGSFLGVYKTPDVFSKHPPSILGDLVGNGECIHTAMIPDTVRDLSYIAIFPPSPHFHMITRCCPRVDRLYTQFVPRNDILENRAKLEFLDVNDLWMERNTCYAYIMRELFNNPPTGNFRYLKFFESGDAADRDAWNMAVEYMKRAGAGWSIESTGVFIKSATEEQGTGDGRSISNDISSSDEQTRPLLLVWF